MGIIYLAFYNNKGYVGQTRQGLAERKRKHLLSVKKGSKTKFHNFLRKYGDLIQWRIIDIVPDTELNNAEIKWIAYYSTRLELCNHTIGGDGTAGFKQTQETKAKISSKLKGRVVNVKSYTLISPDGKAVEITNLRAFCREYGLDQSNMTKVAKGKLKSAYGWRLK